MHSSMSNGSVDNDLPSMNMGMDMDGDDKPNVSILVLNLIGCLCLSVLAVSFGLSKRLERRDPVVSNFVYTWILQSGLATFDELVLFSGKQLDPASDTREAVLTLITLVSTLNLSIHLIFVLRSAFHESRSKTRKVRSAILVISPYIIGLIPVIELFDLNTGQFAFASAALAVGILTPFVDLTILVYYIRWYDKTKKAHYKNLVSLSFCMRLLAFSLHRLLYIVLLFLDLIGEYGPKKLLYLEVFSVVQNLFPLLAFFVIGLHIDILSLWFPCLSRFRAKSNHPIKHDSSYDAFSRFSPFTLQRSMRRPNPEYVNIDPMEDSDTA